jgi:hypothetical protein
MVTAWVDVRVNIKNWMSSSWVKVPVNEKLPANDAGAAIQETASAARAKNATRRERRPVLSVMHLLG